MSHLLPAPKALAVLACAVTAAGGAALLAGAAPSHAQSPPVVTVGVAAGYVTVRGDEAAVGAAVTLPSAKGYVSNFRAPVLRHFTTGSYSIVLPALADPNEGAAASGVVHARALGTSGTCVANDVENLSSGDLGIILECTDGQGRAADRPFTLSYTRGGTLAGDLVTARLDQDVKPGTITPKFQESSVGGKVTITTVKPGSYMFNLPAIPGTGPATIAVSAMGGFHGRSEPTATCSILSSALVSGRTIEQVRVSCRRLGDAPGNNGEAVDPGVAISYARNVNLLGDTRISGAYLSMPKTTAVRTVLSPARARNQIFGQTDGQVVVTRKNAGTYQVDLQNQEGGFPPETAIATAEGRDAACRTNPSVNIPGNDEQTLLVTCTDIAGHRIDAGFQLQYSAHQ